MGTEAMDTEPVFSHIRGDHNDLMVNVARLYLKPGDRVADLTLEGGVSCHKIDPEKYGHAFKHLLTGARYRFARLSEKGELPYDHVILDPPAETTKGMYYDDIIQVYHNGMKEAFRVLKHGGLLWVNCKEVKARDEVESSCLRLGHTDIRIRAEDIGFSVQDLFLLSAVELAKNPYLAYPLWVFKKPENKREARVLEKTTVRSSMRGELRHLSQGLKSLGRR